MAPMMMDYCTKCDKDVQPPQVGTCGFCHSPIHVIHIHSDEQCAVCGDVWGNHGHVRSAATCPNKTGRFFGSGILAGQPAPVFANGQVAPTHTLAAAKSTGGTAFPSYDEILALAQGKTQSSAGMKCAKCGDFNDYGAPNHGSEYICYVCRHR